MTIEVHIDITLRCGTHGQMTFSGWNDVQGEQVPHAGTSVLAVDPTTDLAAPAIVVAVNQATSLVYLVVAWRELKNRSLYPPAEAEVTS